LAVYAHFSTLREIARFDGQGLWSQADVWFSRFGTLLATAEVFVNRSPRGFFADELARALHVEVQDALHQLTQQRRVTREMVSGPECLPVVGAALVPTLAAFRIGILPTDPRYHGPDIAPTMRKSWSEAL
jgi:hypothetical protein